MLNSLAGTTCASAKLLSSSRARILRRKPRRCRGYNRERRRWLGSKPSAAAPSVSLARSRYRSGRQSESESLTAHLKRYRRGRARDEMLRRSSFYEEV